MYKLKKGSYSIPFIFLLAGLCLFSIPQGAEAQNKVVFGHADSNVEPFYGQNVFQTLDFRNIGPYRGGRASDVEGLDDKPLVYYTAFTGGGVYKTVNGGQSWFNITDGYIKTGSVGAIAVSNSDPNVIYIGMGEACIRGNMSTGDGIYKSTDGGKTWEWVGLGHSHVIGEIVIHPTKPNVVWVAAMGQTFGRDGSKQRGVFKTTNGGKTWEKVLYKGPHAGAVHIEIDPNNPRILYASLWEAYRTPWSMSSGGREEGGYDSGLYKTTDGGKTWTLISDNPGMPKGILGKIEVGISEANSDRIYALIEAENDGGLYRSDNAGKTWKLVSTDPRLTQRAWYYTHITVDPQDPNTVYALNAPLLKSTDGGKTWTTMSTPHGDHHDLWIDPDNPDRMIVADDGGGQISYDGGKSWTSMMVYSTAQFYHVNVDDRFPYRVYGAQQDNSTVVIKNRTAGAGIGIRAWHPVGGGESGYITPDPDNENIVYAGSYGGDMTRYNSETEESTYVNVWPDDPMGHGAEDLKYRFQWTYPIYINPAEPDVLYTTSQYVHRSTDQGMSWERISPDLTRDEEIHQQDSGGPITDDDTSIEYYNTIYSFKTSSLDTDILWAGADDGLVHVSRDDGQTWTDVTPDALAAPEDRARIFDIEPSPFDKSTVYIAASRYKQGNFEPLLFKSTNFGESWTKIIKGIPPKEFTRAIEADPFRKGVLYVGTETGMYISFNDGGKWQKFQLNLPTVPVTDIAIQKEDRDLVISTQGRGFYILDEMAVIDQLSQEIAQSRAYLFGPEPAYQFGRRGGWGAGGTEGQNPFRGPVIHYYLNGVDKDAEIELQFLKGGEVIRTFSDQHTVDGEPVQPGDHYDYDGPENPSVLTDKEGMNRFVWNMRYPGVDVELEDEPVWWGGTTRGPEAVPGTYTVRLLINNDAVMKQQFEIRSDPRETASIEDLQAQFDLVQKIQDKLADVLLGIKTLRNARSKVVDMMKNVPDDSALQERLTKVKKALTEIEHNLTQVKSESGQDPLNYGIQIDNKLAGLASTVMRGKRRPTESMYAVYEALAKKADKQLRLLEKVLNGKLIQKVREVENKSIPFQNY